MKEKELTSEELKQLLEKDNVARQEKCMGEINVILKKYNCQLASAPRFTPDGRTVADVYVNALS